MQRRRTQLTRQGFVPPRNSSLLAVSASPRRCHPAAMGKISNDAQPPRMSDEEKRLARKWYKEGKPRAEIAELLSRDLSNICKLLKMKSKPNPVGRPKLLSEKEIDALVATLDNMVDKAEATYEVTAMMVKKTSKCKCSLRTMRNALHARGYWFRDLRHKPILTPQDVKDRFAWAKEHRSKSKAWWTKNVHIHLDNHMFKVATTSKGRKLLAKRRVRGVYRKKGKSLRAGHVKPNPKLKQYTGGKGILKTGGVGGGRVLVWHTVTDRWNGDAAAYLYNDVVSPALKKQYPTAKKFTLLEDNDPTGNTSKKGIAAKEKGNIKVFTIPLRSPELNVLDYAVWAEVEKRMRKQELRFDDSRRETRAQFEIRLDRTARNLPASFITKAIEDLRDRCKRLYEAKGALFEEGGKKRRPL